MMKKGLKVLLVTLGCVFAFYVIVYNNYILKSELNGKYVNYNYDTYQAFVAEIPYEPDTIVLYGNNKVSSQYYGEGEYEVTHKFLTTQIDFSFYVDNSGIQKQVKREFNGNPKIMLYSDEGHCYKKIK